MGQAMEARSTAKKRKPSAKYKKTIVNTVKNGYDERWARAITHFKAEKKELKEDGKIEVSRQFQTGIRCGCSCSGSLQGGRRFLEAKKNEEKFESFYKRGGEGKGKNKAEKRSKKELFGEKMEGREENRSRKRKRERNEKEGDDEEAEGQTKEQTGGKGKNKAEK